MSKLTDVIRNQILRGLALQVCHETGAVGASTQLIAAALCREGFATTADDVADACRYLEGKGLIETVRRENKALQISRAISRVTPLGTDVLEGTAQAEGVEIGHGA